MVEVPELTDDQVDNIALATGAGMVGYVAYEFSENQPEMVGIGSALVMGYFLSR